MSRLIITTVATLAASLSAPLSANLRAQAPVPPRSTLTVDRIFRTGEFSATRLPALNWLKDGRSFIDAVPAEGGGSDIVRTDAVTGAKTVLVPASALVKLDGKRMEVEDMSLSTDETKALLFHDSERVWRQNTKGQYDVVDFATKKPTRVSPNTEGKLFAKLSPDGRQVAFVRANNIFAIDLASGVERQLTTDGSDTIINGTTDWVYEEEFDLRDAFRWSPDGRRIAFWRFDQSAVPVMSLVNQTDSLYPIITTYRYPKAGTPNSVVKLGVVSVADGTTRWIDTGSDSSVYLPRMEWAGADSVWLERLPRKQNRVDLMMASATTGAMRPILVDRDLAYVDVQQPVWLAGGKQFLWKSDRSGWRQIYLYNRNGTIVRQLTQDGSDVLQIAGVDERRGDVYVQAAAPSATQRQIFRYSLDGRRAMRVTGAGGSHTFDIAPGARYAADTHSSINVPPAMTLYELPTMRPVRLLADNMKLKANIDTLNIPATEFIRVPAADGTTMLDGYRIVPAGFDSTRKYPVLMYVYGGPASPQVNDAWNGSRYLFHLMMAQRGYVVVVVDNRGSAWRGRDFRKMTQYRLGMLESDDQIAAAKWIGRQPWGDAKRIGIWGWSYGGFMTAMSTMRGGSVFRMGMSVAPVTDWRLYDTIYTERLMWTPQENAEGYRITSPQNYVSGLTAKYLLVHGTGDDNVHVQNTLQMAQKLELARKPFSMVLFPNKTHAIAGPGGTLAVFDLLERFILENL